MAIVVKNALVAYSAEQMFDLVLDVEHYPQFLPWCVDAQSNLSDEVTQNASLKIDYLGIKQQFTTSNTFIRNKQLLMQLEQGPFKHLIGKWQFEALSETACKLYFSLDFEFDNFLLRKVATPIFIQIADTMLDAFIKRAKEIYD